MREIIKEIKQDAFYADQAGFDIKYDGFIIKTSR